MILAAVAADNAILPVLQVLESLAEGEVCAVWGENPSLMDLMASAAPAAKRLHSWDEIFNQQGIDTLLVSGVSDSVLSAARQALHAGLKLLVILSPNADAVRTFDYTALWQEASERVLPIFLSGIDQVSRAVNQQYETEQMGRLWKIEFERTLQKTDATPALSVMLAQQWFLQDCAWIHELDPQATQIAMTTTGPIPNAPIEVQIRISGENVLDCRWVLKTDACAGWKLTFIGELQQIQIATNGTAPLVVSSPYPITLPVETDSVQFDIDQQLRKIVDGQSDRDWTDVIKLGEFGATAGRSLAKRRTLPVHFEEASERSQFKSQMAAIGCGVLLWTMFSMIALLVLGAVSDPRDREYLTSSSANFVLRSSAFQHGKASSLTHAGKVQLEEIGRKWSAASPVVIIEQQVQFPVSMKQFEQEQNEDRQKLVIEELLSFGVRSPAERVVLRTLPGQWFETAMLIGWVFVFLPLGAVLLAQLLYVVSRPLD